MTKQQNIKRIEATLHNLDTQPTLPSSRTKTLSESTPSVPPVASNRPLSFEIQPKTIVRNGSDLPALPGAAVSQEEMTLEELIEPFGIHVEALRFPALPRLNSPGFTSHHNAANPALAANLLKNLAEMVSGWQDELQQVLRQIQDLYLEGPIVNGWLESYAAQQGTAPSFRHAEVNCLMNYVENLSPTTVASKPDWPSPPASQENTNPGYRLCGLSEDGQLWFRHCPAAQVPAVSLAIVRYQRLQTLLTQKQALELRLSQLAETLISIGAQFRQPSASD